MRLVKKIALISMIFSIIAIAVNTQAEELKVRRPTKSEIGKTEICPVMNSKFEVVEGTPVIDYKGKSYYLCCDRCVDDFKKDPDKFAGSGELLVRQPAHDEVGKTVTCPVMNSQFEVTQSTQVIDYKGKSYFFCSCPSCIEDFKKNPDKYSK